MSILNRFIGDYETRLTFMRTAILLLMMMLGAMIHAQEYESATLTMVNGTTTTVKFSGEPTIKFTDGKLIITTDEATTEFDRQDIRQLTYNVVAGVENVNRDDISIDNNGEALVFSNLPYGSKVNVYDLSGRLLKSETASGNSFELPFNSLSKGIYIVSVNGVSTKISVTR